MSAASYMTRWRHSSEGLLAQRAVPALSALRDDRCPACGRVRRYTDAVVTPPSITMVWPVMKVEASEAR